MSLKRWVLVGAAAGGLPALAFAGTAGAEQHTVTVTLLGGKVITITVDVPAGTPLDQLKLPVVATPVVGVVAAPQPAQPDAPASSADAEAAEPARPSSPVTKAKKKRAPVRKVVAKPGPGPHAKAKPRRRAKLGVEANGMPTVANPTFSYALPGPAPIGVPNFFIDRFRIPPFLLPIYQAAGIQYGVRWEVLAAINEIETDYGRNLSVSTAGAEGWMQFMPATWKTYGTDANGDGERDPYNPVDAIFSAARYLKAAGAGRDIKKAVFAYNHADWYVDSVLMRARLIAGTPADLIGSLTGLTEGRFPVYGASTYAGALDAAKATKRVRAGNASVEVHGDATRRDINVFAASESAVVAVQDGTIVALGKSRRLGRYVVLRDAYGNSYTYAGLKSVAKSHAVLRDAKAVAAAAVQQLDLPAKDAAPATPASAGGQALPPVRLAKAVTVTKERLFANPARKRGGDVGSTNVLSRYLKAGGLKRDQVRVVALRRGSRVIAGTVLGKLGVTHDGIASHLNFRIRPSGDGAPLIDPKPILDGWKLLESTAIYRAAGANPFHGSGTTAPSIGQLLLLSKDALARRVLDDPNIDIYAAGRDDIKAGSIDRRVLATLAFLSASGLNPTVSCLRSGHSLLTSSGNISEHSSGNAVDVAKINGISIAGHQGAGSITEMAIRRLLTLQGTMKPHQIISLMTFTGADNTLALPDHADHIHIGFSPSVSGRFTSVLKPGQWTKLVERLGTIENPEILTSVADR